MFKLLLLGTLAGLFFSTTFILNELMSSSGGHWVWSASLRYFFMIVLLSIIIFFQGGFQRLKDVLTLFWEYKFFWIIAGSIGFGAFYALLCFGADFAPGWMIASTWQFTVVATLFILMLFGRKFSKRVWGFSFAIFVGVCLVNVSHIEHFELSSTLLGSLPVLLAAFCYPFGNQLVWEARYANHKLIPHIQTPLLHNAFHKVFLLSLGSLPLWVVLILFTLPPLPPLSQVFNTFLVALFSGIFATVIFLYARNQATNSNELAGIDATQASEVVFALLGGVVFLHSNPPTLLAWLGLGLVIGGLVLFVRYQKEG